jgi:hypothetical protein
MTNNKPITKLDPTTFTTRDSKEVAKINEIIDRLNAMNEAILARDKIREVLKGE